MTRPFVLFFLLLSLAGCFETPPPVGPYEHDHFSVGIISNYPEMRTFNLLMRDNITTPGQPRENSFVSEEVTHESGKHGIGLACPDLGQPTFYLKVVLKDGRSPEVVGTQKWVGLVCSTEYTLVLSENGRMNLYHGRYSQPPFENPMQEVAP